MVLLKEDGTLDVEKINQLPYEEFMDAMGNLTRKQVEEYLAKTPLNESYEPIQIIEVDYHMEEDGVDADELIIELRNSEKRE